MSRKPAIPLLSFFTGGGLLDVGLHAAGFRPVWTNEFDPKIADMYEFAAKGLRETNVGQRLATRISSRESITKLDPKSIRREAFPKGKPTMFGVVGGPPCPDFSAGGLHHGGSGAKGRLTKTFIEMICDLKADFFLLENVAGLFKFKKHRRFFLKQVAYLESIGEFATDFSILNALHLGVPQSRDRLFLIGIRRSAVNRAIGRKLLPGEKDWFPWPTVPKYKDALDWTWPTSCKFGNTPVRPQHLPYELMVDSVLGKANDPEALPNGLDVFQPHSPKFKTRREGDVGNKSFKRLHRYRYSPTAWFGNREVHLHPWKPRRLSVREALRIQSAPDTYVLPPDSTLSAKFCLIGNGVPCQMATQVGDALRAFLRQT